MYFALGGFVHRSLHAPSSSNPCIVRDGILTDTLFSSHGGQNSPRAALHPDNLPCITAMIGVLRRNSAKSTVSCGWNKAVLSSTKGRSVARVSKCLLRTLRTGRVNCLRYCILIVQSGFFHSRSVERAEYDQPLHGAISQSKVLPTTPSLCVSPLSFSCSTTEVTVER